MEMEIELSPRRRGGGSVTPTRSGWRLEMPAGAVQTYRLAQLDDYANSRRRQLRHTPPWSLHLRARVSAPDLPGTWGFGLWNDPFGFSIGFGGRRAHLPALPQTAWFMHASPPNWLSLQSESTLPANGFFAGTYRSASIPSPLLAPALAALPLLALRPLSRLLRRMASRLICQDAVRVDVEVTAWHEYSILWLDGDCSFQVDGVKILRSFCSPRPPLGLVLWIDNQYAAWTPEGRLAAGTLENPSAWMEIEDINVQLA